MSITPNTTFSWKNYTKPTPKNLLGVAAAFRRMVTLVTGASIIMEAEPWVPITVLITGGILDELKNFFATIVEDEKTESAVAEFPSGKEVVITQPIDPKPE
jgi:hypothetical protein